MTGEGLVVAGAADGAGGLGAPWAFLGLAAIGVSFAVRSLISYARGTGDYAWTKKPTSSTPSTDSEPVELHAASRPAVASLQLQRRVRPKRR